jgi:glycosyltransferase involved in cell wall biosynthesis
VRPILPLGSPRPFLRGAPLLVTAHPPPPLRFSVIVPAYNAERTLAGTLASAVSQSHPPYEVLVIDDGSTDETAAVAEAVGAPVRVIRKPNGGTASARNVGLREATGDVLAFLDADDRYEPGRLAQIAAAFEADPSLEAVATDAAIVRDGERLLASSWWPRGITRGNRVDASAPVIFATLALRRRLVDELGGFDSRYEIVEDLDYWYRLGCGGHAIGYVPEASYVYVVHAAAKTSTRSPIQGHREFVEISLRHALARSTPMRLRPRLAIRGLRHLGHLVKAAAAR